MCINVDVLFSGIEGSNVIALWKSLEQKFKSDTVLEKTRESKLSRLVRWSNVVQIQTATKICV